MFNARENKNEKIENTFFKYIKYKTIPLTEQHFCPCSYLLIMNMKRVSVGSVRVVVVIEVVEIIGLFIIVVDFKHVVHVMADVSGKSDTASLYRNSISPSLLIILSSKCKSEHPNNQSQALPMLA